MVSAIGYFYSIVFLYSIFTLHILRWWHNPCMQFLCFVWMPRYLHSRKAAALLLCKPVWMNSAPEIAWALKIENIIFIHYKLPQLTNLHGLPSSSMGRQLCLRKRRSYSLYFALQRLENQKMWACSFHRYACFTAHSIFYSRLQNEKTLQPKFYTSLYI